MIENWVLIILSSAVISAITSGLIAYTIEKRKFSQEYWKITIQKRLDAYDELEKVLIYFQTTHLIRNNPCHLAFVNLDAYNSLQTELGLISNKRNWFSNDLYQKIIELNRLLYKLEFEEGILENDVSKFGVENYSEIASIRDKMLNIITDDYINMPQVKSFFKNKMK